MSGYVLTFREDFPLLPSDGSALRPDVLGGLEPAALAAVPLPVGRTRPPLRDLVAISGGPGDTLTLRGAPPLPRLAAGMQGGTLVIEGDAGDDLGASMAGGLIRVGGRVGDRVGGPDHARTRGMTGGEIVVAGAAGACAGFRMRRGLIAIGGPCGPSPGYRMLAGTIVLAAGHPDHPGLGMRRGTILCLGEGRPAPTGEAFAEEGRFAAAHQPVVRLILARLRRLGFRVDASRWTGSFRLYSGDRFELNRGEVWQYSGA